MENKINIAELLKDCPSGMELDCTMYENVYFDKIYDEDCLYQIGCYTINDGVRNSINFTKYGEFNTMRIAKCVIFPKGKTTWEGFQRPFKDGDILISGLKDCGNNPFIFKQTNGFGNAQCYCAINVFEEFVLNSDNWTPIKSCRLATEEEKEKLFQAIKDNGYKWNAETKTLEKLLEPKFKVGDRVKRKEVNYIHIVTIVEIDGEYYTYVNQNGEPAFISIKNQDKWELVPNKFDINTLKPFDKVLVRQEVYGKWGINFFGFYNYDEGYYYTTGNWIYRQCIPYEGNEHLLGTTDDCDNFYKTW